MRLCVGTAKGIVVLDTARNGAAVSVSANPSAIGCMAQSAGNPAVLYAGCNAVAGAADFMPAADADSGSLYRSENGGRDWIEITGRVLHGEAFWALAAPPDEPAELWVGATHGRLFHSDDFGHSFAECQPFRTALSSLQRNLSRAAQASHVTTIAFDPADPAVIYAALADGGAFRSPDRGTTFHPLDRRINRGLNQLAVDQTDPRCLYAATGHGFYRSESAGRSWERVTDGLTRPYLHPVLAARGGMVYTAGAAGNPAVWIRGDGADARLFASADQGRSFKAIGGMQEALRGMVMRMVSNPWVAGEVFAVTSDGSVLRWSAGEEDVQEIARQLPPAFDLAILP